jgi:hypothetical protein
MNSPFPTAKLWQTEVIRSFGAPIGRPLVAEQEQ